MHGSGGFSDLNINMCYNLQVNMHDRGGFSDLNIKMCYMKCYIYIIRYLSLLSLALFCFVLSI